MSVTISGSDGVNQGNITGASVLPVGTSAQRPAAVEAGMIRFNSSTQQLEVYDGTDWAEAGGNGVATAQIFFLMGA